MARTTPTVSRLLPPVRNTLEEAGDVTAFSGSALRALPGVPRFASEVMRHTGQMIAGTSLLLFVMSMFQGMSVINFGYFFLRTIGASDYTGLLTGYVVPRQLAPAMFGYVFAGKICCGMAATIGAMRVNQEVEALESTGVDPMRYVVGTRIVATLIFAPIAAFIAMLGVYFGGYFEAVHILHGVSGPQMSQVHWSVETWVDQLFCAGTITLIALTCTLVACFYGMRARGGPAEVGHAVARSLVANLVLLHVIAATAIVFYYGSNVRLPIAGG